MATSLQETVLRRATSVQIHETWKNTHPMWGRNATLEEYLDQEAELGNSGLSASFLTNWVLVPRDDPDTKEIYAHCETYQQPALLCECGFYEDPKKLNTTGIAIASVFCPEKYRRRGFAARMLQLLDAQFKNAEDVTFSVLFSDIGKRYYADIGWKVYPSKQLSVNVSTEPIFENTDVQYLLAEDLEELVEQDCALIRSEMLIHGMTTTRPTVAILPTMGKYQWFFTRQKLEYRGPRKPATHVGARLSTGGRDLLPARLSFVVWKVDYDKKILQILRLRYANKECLHSLIQACKKTAALLDLTKVVFWIRPEDDLSKDLSESADVTERDTSLPSMAFWGKKIGHSSEIPDWHYCEKYAWV